MKRVIKWVLIVLGIALLVYVLLWVYVIIHIVFTYQCKIYDGSGFDAEQRQICADYNSGGLRKVLTK